MTRPEKQIEYKTNMTEQMQELATNSDDSLDTRCNKITCAIRKTAEEAFGGKKKKTTNDWLDEECQEVREAKNKAYVNMQQRSYTRASTDEYREARRKEKHTWYT